MPQSKTMRFRAAPARGVSGQVDREKGIIHGIAVVTMGEARGHGVFLDEEFIDETVKNGNNLPKGLKSRFGHPNMSSSAVGTLLGRVKNFRKDMESGVPIARGDLHLTESAKSAPGGDLYTHVLDLAENDPDQFGTSIVFERGNVYKRDNSGNKIFRYDQDGTRNNEYENTVSNEYVEQKTLRADDVVDEPAANPDGLFSMFSSGQPAAIVTQFLDENPDIWEMFKDENVEDVISAFRDRYAAYKELHTEPNKTTKEPETMADENKNADQGRVETVAELASLETAFPNDLNFAVASFKAGKTVEQAKAEYCDTLTEQLSAAKEEIAELKTQLSEKPDTTVEAEGADPVEHLEAGLQDSDKKNTDDTAESKFSAFKKESGLEGNAAVVAFREKHPELIDELNK